MPTQFLDPAMPVLRPEPPTGEGWLHEVKFDGFRVQVHKAVGGAVTIHSRRGHDYTTRFKPIAVAAAALPASSFVLDGEAVALDEKGHPDFDAVMRRRVVPTLYAFDVLMIEGRDLRMTTLTSRRKVLAALLSTAPHAIRMSDVFEDPGALLAALEPLAIEGIVSKRANGIYRGGTRSGWIKVKTAAWRKANAGRWERFQR